MRKLHCEIDGVTRPLSVVVSEAHSSSMTTAVISCISTTLTIGDKVDIYLGYSDDYPRVFTGYVKIIEKKVPENTYVLTLYDEMVRATDFFIASANPDAPFSRENIAAEELVRDLLQLAGLAGAGKWVDDPTSFTLGTSGPIDINLISSYDISKQIADALTWALWADKDGVIHFENRKPYPMEPPDPGQPGWEADVSENEADPFDIGDFTDLSYRISEKDLRNRVVVYGGNSITATASEVSPYLPAGFYKSIVAAFQFIDTQADANKTANYNLNLFNRLTKEINISLIGNPELSARKVYTISENIYNYLADDETYEDIKNWYAFSCEHNWSRNGYLTNLLLRRGVTG